MYEIWRRESLSRVRFVSTRTSLKQAEQFAQNLSQKERDVTFSVLPEVDGEPIQDIVYLRGKRVAYDESWAFHYDKGMSRISNERA